MQMAQLYVLVQMLTFNLCVCILIILVTQYGKYREMKNVAEIYKHLYVIKNVF